MLHCIRIGKLTVGGEGKGFGLSGRSLKIKSEDLAAEGLGALLLNAMIALTEGKMFRGLIVDAAGYRLIIAVERGKALIFAEWLPGKCDWYMKKVERQEWHSQTYNKEEWG
jgi:hypothetical protein